MKKQGFTLIELMVVVAIISLLTSIVLAALNDARKKARDAKRLEDLHQIRIALQLYFEENGQYPLPGGCAINAQCQRSSNNFVAPGWDGSGTTLASALAPYISLPKDPINTGGCNYAWLNNCFVYTYGIVGNNPHRYDLIAQFEGANHPLRCELKNWRQGFGDTPYCPAWGGPGTWSNNLYKALIN